jgi:hypothetical protein
MRANTFPDFVEGISPQVERADFFRADENLLGQNGHPIVG